MQGYQNSTTLRIIHVAGNGYMNTNQTLTFNPRWQQTMYGYVTGVMVHTTVLVGFHHQHLKHHQKKHIVIFHQHKDLVLRGVLVQTKTIGTITHLYVGSGYGIGANNGTAKGNFKFKKFVASKLKIATD